MTDTAIAPTSQMPVVSAPPMTLYASRKMPEARNLVSGFLARFPLATTTEVSARDFDNWCEAHGLFDGFAEGYACVVQRNNVRNIINHIVTSKEWREKGLPQFEIVVKAYGKSYSIISVVSGFAREVEIAPMKRLRQHRDHMKKLERLKDTFDMNALPEKLRIQIEAQFEFGVDVEMDLTHQLAKANRHYEALRTQIALASSQAAALLSDDSECDDDDTDEVEAEDDQA